MAGRSIKTDLPSPQEIQESESGGQNSKKPHINPALDEATQRLILDMDLPAGFAERITSLPHEFLLVVFNCQPTSRAEKEKIPEDFHLRCREFGHSQATGSNKLLELLGDRALGLIVAGWLQTQCTTTKQLKDASRRLTRNRILAALALRLRLLEYPDLCMGRHDQWQTHRWVKEVFVKKILSGILPKVLANLVEALLGAHWLCGGHQQLKELLEMLLPHLASVAIDPALAHDHSQADDYQLEDSLHQKEATKLEKAIYNLYDDARKCRTVEDYETSIAFRGRNLRTAVTRICVEENIKNMSFDESGSLRHPFSFLSDIGDNLIKLMILTSFIPAYSGMFLRYGGELVSVYVSALTDQIMTPAVLGLITQRQELTSLVDWSHWEIPGANHPQPRYLGLADVMVASVGCFYNQFPEYQSLEPFFQMIVAEAHHILKESI